MIPLVDIHCHLLAGLDDGPATEEESLAMCRLATEEGIQFSAATAHQNDAWPNVTPQRIREATGRLAENLRRAEIPLTVFPSAEVTASPETEDDWAKGGFLGLGGNRRYLLLEFPPGRLDSMVPVVTELCSTGVRVVLAHAERYPELLHESGTVESLIRRDCLIQVNAESVTDPPSLDDGRALRRWLKRGYIHLLGSDGHSTRNRPPRLRKAYQLLARLAGQKAADRIASLHGLAVLQGLPVRVPDVSAPSKRWFF